MIKLSRRLTNELNSINLNIEPSRISSWNLNIFDKCLNKIIHHEIYGNNNILSDIDFLIYINNKYYIVNLFDLNEYPFRSPRIKINNTNYLNLLRNEYFLYNNKLIMKKIQIDKRNLDKILNINTKSCCCCKSIICNDNWTPVHNIGHIFTEIFNYINRKQKFIEVLYLNLIMLKKINFTFDYMFEFI